MRTALFAFIVWISVIRLNAQQASTFSPVSQMLEDQYREVSPETPIGIKSGVLRCSFNNVKS